MTIAWAIQAETMNVPAGWRVRRIGDLVSLVNGFPFSSEDFGPNGDMPLVRIRDLLNAEFETYVSGYIPREVVLRNGDVIIGMDGEFNLSVWNRGEAALNQRLCLLRPEPGVDIRFVAYALPGILKVINDLTFATTVKHLSSNDILAERIMLPPLEEQRRIADFLDAETSRIDDTSRLQREILDLLAERRRTAVAHLATGTEEVNRAPSRLAWTDSLPAHWNSVGLSLVAKMGSGHTPSRSRPEWWVDCNIPWITTGEVAQVRNDRQETIYETREKISALGLANSSAELHPAGTVVLSRTASAGFSAVMGHDMATSQDYATWTCGPKLNPYYLLWCLRVMRSDLLGRLAMGSTHKTIYFPDLQGIRIPLPPIDEQVVIVEAIRESNAKIDELHDRINRQLGLLAERRQALITAAVTGQLDVTTARTGVVA